MIKVTVGQDVGKPKVFHVHVGVLCRHSAFFRAALNGAFPEAQTNSIALPEDNPMRFEQILCWMYGQQDIFPTQTDKTMADIFDFLVLADKLLVEPSPADYIAKTYMRSLICGDRVHTAEDGVRTTGVLCAENIRRAYDLPFAKPIAKAFAKHSVPFYMDTMDQQSVGDKEFRFEKEAREVHGYAADVLFFTAEALRAASEQWQPPRTIAYLCPDHDSITELFVRNSSHTEDTWTEVPILGW